MQTDEEVETRTIISPLGRSTIYEQHGLGRGGRGEGKIVGGWGLEVASGEPSDSCLLSDVRSFVDVEEKMSESSETRTACGG